MKATLLNREEEVELARRIQAGDEAAREELIRRNEPYAVWRATRTWEMSQRQLDWDDVYQEARAGIVEAANRFTPAMNCPFVFHAKRYVNDRISNLLRFRRTHMWIPEYMHQSIEKDSKGKPLHRRCTPKLLAMAKEAVARSTQFVAPRSPEGRRLERAAPEPSADEVEMRDQVERMLGLVNERDREILRRRFGIGGRTVESFWAISLDLGICEDHARAAIARLREALIPEAKREHQERRRRHRKAVRA